MGKYEIPMPATRIEELSGRPFTLVYPDALAKIKKGVCPTCDAKIKDFRDDLSYKEYLISGMCQMCQDKSFKRSE